MQPLQLQAEPPQDDTAHRAMLAARGLRVTGPRLALLRLLADSETPMTHAELYARLENGGYDRVTLYRNLQTLCDVGLLIRTEMGDRTWRFSLPSLEPLQHSEHAHFVCVGCGQVRCLPTDAVALRTSALGGIASEVQVRGRCGQCLAGDATT